MKIVRLLNDWAQRSFAICFRRSPDLSPASARLVDYLADQAKHEAP